MRRSSLALSSFILALVAVGCGSNEAGSPDASTPKAGGGPTAMFDTMTRAVEEQKPELVWNYFPASYRNDVNGVIHEFANRFDPEVWSKAFGVAGKVVQVMKTKRDFILATPMVSMMTSMNPDFDMEKVKDQWGAAVEAMESLLSADVSTLDELKNFEVGKFLAKGGLTTFLKKMDETDQPLTIPFWETPIPIQKLKATVVEETGTVARVKVEAPGQEPKEIDLVKVEGVWLFKDLVDGWSERMEEARKSLEEMAMDPQEKTQFMMLAGMIEATLDNLIAAKSKEEFDQAVAGIMQAMGPMMGGGQR